MPWPGRHGRGAGDRGPGHSGSAATDTAGDTTGVTAKEIKVGYICSKAGLAGSTFENAGEGFEARIEAPERQRWRQRPQDRRDHRRRQRVTNNLVAAQGPRAEPQVFAVVNNSPFAFLGYRFLLENGVPMSAGATTATSTGRPGNEKLISILGNSSPVVRRAVQPGFVELMKKAGAKKVGVVAYGSSASSTAVGREPPEVRGPRRAGSTPSYTNTNVDFGTPTSVRWCWA